jgi:hypothetical protein
MATGDGVRTFFYLGHSPVRSVDEVLIEGIPTTGYVGHAGNGWISMANPPGEGESVEIHYTYSMDLDLGVTNWDSNLGNYLFRNIRTSDVPDVASALAGMRVFPNPVSTRTRIRYRGEAISDARLAIYDVSGRLVKSLHHGPLPEGLRIWEWDRRDGSGLRVSGGVYFTRMETVAENRLLKLVVLD